MIKSKKQMFMVITSFILIMLLTTVTYAFFNYTRTGVANRIQVGRIYFNSEHTNVNLDNIFPIASSEVEGDTENVSTVTIHVTGDTTYSEGIEYLISAVDINNTINDKIIPINVNIGYVANEYKTIGTLDENYYTNRGGNTSIYKILSNKVYLEDNNKLLVGYIANGETGIDGTLTIKAYLDKDKIAISDTYPSKTKRIVNPNMTEEEMNDCANYWINKSYFYEIDDATNFCNGTGKYFDRTFQERIDSNYFYSDYLEYLINHNIVKEIYTDETTSEWVRGRVALTTDEWNSLNNSGLSFKVKVEASEGIWAGYPGNAMEMLPSPYSYSTMVNSVKEIQFINMPTSEIDTHYNDATYKGDITANTEGSVRYWLEPHPDDNSMNIMYVASDGITYFTSCQGMFTAWHGLEKIEFHNINSSRVTNMSSMFYLTDKLKEVDLTMFDTSNVTSTTSFVYRAKEITKINLTGLDFSKAEFMYNMFAYNPKLKDVILDGTKTRDVRDMANFFYNSPLVDNVNLEGWGGDNLSSVTNMFGYAEGVTSINMKNFNFGNVTSLTSFFKNLKKLENIDLSNAKAGNVTSVDYLFENNTSLINANLSGIDLHSVTSLNSIFSGCTSLENVNMESANFTSVNNLYNTFRDCSSLETIDLSSFNSNIINEVDGLFDNCSSLTTIYVPNNFDLSNVSGGNGWMFNGCTSIVGGSGTTFITYHSSYAHIDGGESNPGYFTLKTS